jgi:hypothetical protein
MVVATSGCGNRTEPAPDSVAPLDGAAGEPRGPGLRSRRFELADFLASTATAVDSPAAARLVAAKGQSAPPAAPPPSSGRFLGRTSDGAGYYLAQYREGTAAQEELLLISPRSALSQTLYLSQPGFRIAAVAPRGDRIALVRELDPDSTEVLLHERAAGVTRLLLPVEQDARFQPLAFSGDSARLFLLSDEGGETLQLEILHLDSGRRIRRARRGCEAGRFDASPDGSFYSLQWRCEGVVEAALFESASGAGLGPLPLPRGTRLARALPFGTNAGVLYEVAAGRLPRDLLFVERLDSEALAQPLTFGLAPAISAQELVEPMALTLSSGGQERLPAELWWPRRAGTAPPALIWLEDDGGPPQWGEFHPFLQFLANRGVAALRLRLRGALGFGKRFRHAADGRLVEAGFEDLDLARAELVRRGADPSRIAVLGEGPWAGSLAATALVERNGRFAAAVDLGGDPDPLRRHDLLAELAEPARTWWLTRLGDPALDPVRRDRQRLRFPAGAGDLPLFVALEPEAGPWSEEARAAYLRLDATRRVELAAAPPGAGGETENRVGFDRLQRPAIESLWAFVATHLDVAP